MTLAWEYWFKTEEAMGMRKILAHKILGCKRTHKPRRTLPGFFTDFMELCGSKDQIAPWHENFINDVANPKSSIRCYFFKYFVLTGFLKKYWTKIEQKFIKYLMEPTWVGSNHLKFSEKWMLWVVSFLGLMRFYQFQFYLH